MGGTYHPRHAVARAVRSLSVKAKLAILAASALAVTAGGFAIAGASSAQAVEYVKAFSYQFASNEANGNWQVSDSPITDPAGTDSLGPNGVTLTASGANSQNYGSAAVVVDLGKLSTLFDSNGNYVPPNIVSSGSTPGVNLYFDTNGDGHYLSFSYDGAIFEGPAGDNLASMESSPSADFTTFQQGNSCLSGQMRMTDVLAAYTSAKCGKTTDPEVWAWIGVQSSNATPVTATITSVNSQNLVKSQPAGPTGHVTGYGGRCLNDYAWSTMDRAPVIQWTCGNYGNETYTFANGELINNYSGLCLNDAGWGGQGTKQIQWDCSPATANELWTYTGNDEYVNQANGLCLNDPGYSTANGVQQILWACVSTANEHYSLPS